MASIGLKVNRDSSGLGIAELMSDALTNSVGDAVAVEKLKSALLTDDMQRRLLREQTTLATQEAIAKSMENKYNHANCLAAYDAAEEATGLQTYMEGGGAAGAGGGATVPVEAPVLVDDATTAAVAAAAAPGGARPEGPVGYGLPYEMPEIVADPRLAGVPPELLPQPNVPMPPAITSLPPQIALDATAPSNYRPAMPAQPGLAGLPPELNSPLNPATLQPLVPPDLNPVPMPPALAGPPYIPGNPASLPGMPTQEPEITNPLINRTRFGSPDMQALLQAGPTPPYGGRPDAPLGSLPTAPPPPPVVAGMPAIPAPTGLPAAPPPPPVVAGMPAIPAPTGLPAAPDDMVTALGRRVMEALGMGGAPAAATDPVQAAQAAKDNLIGYENGLRQGREGAKPMGFDLVTSLLGGGGDVPPPAAPAGPAALPPMPPALAGVPRDLGGLPPGATVATPDQFITLTDVLSKLGIGGDDGVNPVPVDMDATAATPMVASPAGTPPTSILDSVMQQGVPKEIPNYSSQPPGVPPPPLQATPPQTPPFPVKVAGRPETPAVTGLPGPAPIVNPLDDVMPVPVDPEEAALAAGQQTLADVLPAELQPRRPAPPPPAPPAAPTAQAGAAGGEGDAVATSSAAASPAVDEAATTVSNAVIGVDGGTKDTATTVQTKQGPVERTKIGAMMKYIFLTAGTPEQAVQAAQRWAGTVGATYNPNFGTDPKFTENAASLRQGGAALGRESVLGTAAATQHDIDVAAAKPTYQMIENRLYEVTKGADGKSNAALVSGQPAPGAVNPYGDNAEGNMLNYIDNLLIKGLDKATPEEQRRFETMANQLWGSKVQVAADGTVVVTEGGYPPGVPKAGEAFKSGTLGRSTTGASEGEAAPATADNGTDPVVVAEAGEDAAAPATTQPAETAKKNPKGRYVREDGYTSYGGYLVPGQNPNAPVEQTINGQKVTIAKQPERTKEAEAQTAKQVSYTRQALEPASYFLKLKPGQLKITALEDILTKMGEGTPIQNAINRYATSADDREYFANVVELVKDMSHKDSGADVTKSDLITYRNLYELPLDPTEKDLAMLRRRIKNTLLGAREGFNGAVPSDQLRAWDAAAGRLGIDLDAEETIAQDTSGGGAGANAPVKKGFKVVNGKVVREE